MRHRVFRVKVFQLERLDPHSVTGYAPAIDGTVYVRAKDELDAVVLTQEGLPEGLRGGDIQVVGEIPTFTEDRPPRPLPLWEVRVGFPEPGPKRKAFRAAAFSWYRLVGATDRDVIPSALEQVLEGDPHKLSMVRRGWVEIGREPIDLSVPGLVVEERRSQRSRPAQAKARGRRRR